MGREIREVPLDWQHPKDKRGHYIPMYDAEYDKEADGWLARLRAWEDRTDQNRDTYEKEKGRRCYFWEWDDRPPDRKHYRGPWPSGAKMGVAMYETVSEGTPVSPTFATRAELADWMVTQGYSRKAADGFVKNGWAPSFVIQLGGPILRNAEMYDPDGATGKADLP